LLSACLVSALGTTLGTIAILRARGRWPLITRGDEGAIGGPALVIGVILAVVSTVTIDLHFAIGVIIVVLVGTIDDLIDLSPW